MKIFFAPLAKFAAVAVVALSLGSCNRAEYALLPKSPAYLGTQASSHRAVAVAAPAAVATPVAPAAQRHEPESARITPAQTTLAPTTPAVALTSVALVAPAAPAANALVQPTAARSVPKLSLVQTFLAKKAVKKMGHLMAATQRASHNATAATNRLDGKLRQGLILLLIGILIGIVGGAIGGSIGNLIGLLGLIIAIVGVVLIVLYLFDNL